VWSITSSAPSSRAHALDSGRDAVAITRRRARRLASWMAIEPTPPAPPMISTLLPPSAPVFETPSRSNSASHAVSVVSGSAAALGEAEVARLAATMRSSTRCSSLLPPGRVRLPA